MKVDSETQDATTDVQTNGLKERAQVQTTNSDKTSKVQIQALQIDFENMEESLRNMLRHNGQPSGNTKDDTTRQMHAYKNAISKFRNHINIVERENHALKRQMSSIASQNSPTSPPGHDVTDVPHPSRALVNGEDLGKSQLEDIRSTCLMLSDRIKRMEEQNTQLLMNSEKQRFDYERCLDRVASQVIQALACQRRLQLECDALRTQVHYLTGNGPFAPGQSPHSTSSGASADSPNGPLSCGSVSDDAFSATSPTSPMANYAAWPAAAQNVAAGTAEDPFHPMYSPTYSAQDLHRDGVASRENGFAHNPRMQMLERMFQSTGSTSFNGYPPHLVNLNDLANFNMPSDYQYDRHQTSAHVNNRIQSTKIPPLHVIPESIEPAAAVKSAGFRPRLLRCESEILRGACSVGDIASPRRALDDEIVGCTSRSRDRQRGPKDRHKVARSRSFDNHSYGRNDIGRPQKAMSPRRVDFQMPHNYRPGPPLNSLPNGAALNFEAAELRQAPEKGFMVISDKENMPIRQGHVANSDTSILKMPGMQNGSQITNSPLISRRPIVENRQPADDVFHQEALKANSRPPVVPEFGRQSRERAPARVDPNTHRRSRSQDSRNNHNNDVSPPSSFSRNGFQRSFRVTRSHERPRPDQVSDDVWLPRSGKAPEEQAPGRATGGNSGSGRRKFSRRGSSDLPPPPPPPPEDAVVQENLEQHMQTIENAAKDHVQETEASLPLEQLSWRRKDVRSKKEACEAKKQALKRESYTAACRKSQSLDHLYQFADADEKGANTSSKKEEVTPKNEAPQSGYSPFDLHAKNADDGAKESTEGKLGDSADVSPTAARSSIPKMPNGPDNGGKMEPEKESSPTRYMEMDFPSPRNGRKFLTPPKPTSQLLPPKSRVPNKSSNFKPEDAIPHSENTASRPPKAPSNQTESERYYRLDNVTPAHQHIAAASSCEALSVQANTQSISHRRMSEGMVRGLGGRSKIAAPSHKRLYSGRNQQGSKVNAPREPKQGSPGVTRMFQKQNQKLAPASGSGAGQLGGNHDAIPAGNLPGRGPTLTSASHTDLSTKTRSPPAPRRGGALTTGSHPNLSKSVPESQTPRESVRNQCSQSQGRSIYETSLVSSSTHVTNGDGKSAASAKSFKFNHQPAEAEPGLRPENAHSRSQSVETRSSLPSGKETKVPRRSLSSDRSSKRAANSAKKQLLEQKLERKNDAAHRENSGKKKGGHPKSFVDMMKSKFGGKSGNSQNKKSAEAEKSRRSDSAQMSVTAPQSVIDPRTLSLEPNSIPPPGFSGKKGSKKKSELGNVADPVGRKLSQPFLNVSPQALESLIEVPQTNNDMGGRKSFLKRQNSKRSRGARLAELTKGDHFNNHPFGRVELIPIGSLASLNAMSNSGFADGQAGHQMSPQVSRRGGRIADCEPSDCDREVEAMTNRNLSAHPHSYENVILRPEPVSQGSGVMTQRSAHSYENVILPNATQKSHSDATDISERSRSLDSSGRTNPTEKDDSPHRGKPKGAKPSAAPLRRIWESLSNHSLHKVGENSNSSSSLHQIGGGRCVSGEGSTGHTANVYGNAQKAFEKVFMSSVVEAELASQKEEDSHDEAGKNPRQNSNFHPIDTSNVIEEHASDVITPDYCSSQTESGKSSMTFSTTDSSKSGNSGFDSWPTKGGDLRARLEERQGGSLDACYRNMKPSETFGPYADKMHSPRKVGSRSSLGSFGYGSGVSSNSSSSKSSLHRGRSSRGENRAGGEPSRPQRDSSSDSDLTPSQTPQTNSIQRKYAARKSLSPTGAVQSSRLQKPTRLSRLNGGASPGRVRMGVSSISPETYRPGEKTVAQPEKDVRKLAPLNYAQPLSPALPRSNMSPPTKHAPAKPKEVRRSGLPCSTAANVPVSSRLVPQHTSIPVRYSSQRQQQAR